MFSGGIFWGIIIIAAGLVLIINQIFKVNLPVFRITLGIFLIMLGINFIGGHKLNIHFDSKGNDVVFGSKTIVYTEADKEYNIVFGEAVVDMSAIEKSPEMPLKVNCVFGSAKIYLSSETVLKLDSDVAFGNIDNEFELANRKDSNSVEVQLKASAVFGEIKILKK